MDIMSSERRYEMMNLRFSSSGLGESCRETDTSKQRETDTMEQRETDTIEQRETDRGEQSMTRRTNTSLQ